MKELEVISKIVKINNSDEKLFMSLSDMRNLSKFISPDIKDWHANEDNCSFKVQGKSMSLQIVEKEPFKLIKITTPDENSEKFTVWIQLKAMSSNETAARIVVHLKANFLIRKMIQAKLQDALNQIVEYLKFI